MVLCNSWIVLVTFFFGKLKPWSASLRLINIQLNDDNKILDSTRWAPLYHPKNNRKTASFCMNESECNCMRSIGEACDPAPADDRQQSDCSSRVQP